MDLVLAEDLEAAEVQAAQYRDRCARIHRQDKRWRKFPAEIHLAVRDHIANRTRFVSISPPASVRIPLHVPEISEALGAQQFLENLRADASYGVPFEADRGDFRRRLC